MVTKYGLWYFMMIDLPFGNLTITIYHPRLPKGKSTIIKHHEPYLVTINQPFINHHKVPAADPA